MGRLAVVFALLSLLFFSGCAEKLLPSSRVKTKSPWNTYTSARDSFNQITPYASKFEDLKRLGFHPTKMPNIKVLSYLDIIQRFMPNAAIQKEDLDFGVRECIDAKAECIAYDIHIKHNKRQRYGSVMLDFFNFRKNTKLTGWRFDALILIKNGLVVYTLQSGQPNIDENEEVKNPLGPLQESDSYLIYRLIDNNL